MSIGGGRGGWARNVPGGGAFGADLAGAGVGLLIGTVSGTVSGERVVEEEDAAVWTVEGSSAGFMGAMGAAPMGCCGVVTVSMVVLR
jgi:hypothetical protein